MNKYIKYSVQIVLFTLGLVSTNLLSQSLKTDHPDEYVVQKGDTLWDISARFLEDPWLWPEIWKLNDQVSNPHLIYPGDLLRLVYVDGQPRLVVDRGVVKLSPEIRSTSHDEAISSIPLGSVREFFTKNRVVSKKQLKNAPYMVSGPESRILVAAGDPLYMRGPVEEGVNIYAIFKEGEEYQDPKTGDVLGVRAESKGTARYRNTSGEISRMEVIESIAEISIGDRFLPLQQDQLDPQLFPTIPKSVVSGEILSVEGGVSQIGVLDVVGINRGQDANLEVGHLLAIMEAGERVRDAVEGGTVKLPDEQAGMLMIFKVYDRMSFGLVLESEKALAVGYQVTSLFSQTAYDQNRLDEEQALREKSILHKIRNTKVVNAIEGTADGLGEMFEPDTRPEKGVNEKPKKDDKEEESDEGSKKGILGKIRALFQADPQPE